MKRGVGVNVSLPYQSTSFISRKSELAQIADYLAAPERNLITLTGPGGIGKTRLALEAAAQSELPVYFVPLQPLTQPENIVTAIINELPLQLYDSTNPQSQLLSYLENKQLLLLLDNFEHLLQGVSLVETMLQAAPTVKLLVTSREPLNLQAEWQIAVKGLSYPEKNQSTADLSSVELFAERARNVKPDFELETEKDAVYGICSLVRGMPLAIEIAARWVKFQPCTRIQDDLLDLENRLRDVPERHRSMRAVFNQSWRLLFENERQVFQSLAVFRGGFTVDAASTITGATEQQLANLVDKSVLQRMSADRFTMHELLRQYAEEHLHQDHEAHRQTSQQHARYYLEYLQTRFDSVRGARQRSAILEVATEVENVRVAWQWVIKNDKALPTYAAPYTMAMFFNIKAGTSKD